MQFQTVPPSSREAIARAPPRAYGSVALALHWIVAAALVVQVALGWWMVALPKEPPGLRAGWFNAHKSIGITVALLVLLRLAWRWRHAPPPLPRAMPRWQREGARATHWALYACMLALPAAGFAGSLFSGHPIRFFGWPLPLAVGEWSAGKQAMSAVHYAVAVTLMALAGVHVAAALLHVSRRDGIFRRMWPSARGRAR